jgi:hypothetical protein
MIVQGRVLYTKTTKNVCKHGSLRRFVFELWPTKSSDLNPLDFYLWGDLKSTVYATVVNDVAELQRRVEDGCELIRNTRNF